MKTLIYREKVKSVAAGVSLLLALIVLPGVAQEKRSDVKPARTVRIKMIKNENGKTSLVDTTFKLAEGEEMPEFLKNIKLGEGKDLSQLKEIRVFKSEGMMPTLKEGLKFEQSWKSGDHKGDSTKYIFLRNSRFPDSIRAKMATSPEGFHFRIITTDSLGKHGIWTRDSKSGSTSTVFRLKENGIYEEQPLREIIQEFNGNVLIPSEKKVQIIMIRKFKMTDINEKDIAALKKNLKPADARIKEDLQLKSLEYYPNPSHGSFALSFKSEKKGDIAVKIYDANGREVYTEAVKDFTGRYDKKIDISNLNPGIYFLKVIQGKSAVTKKLIVE